MRRGDYTDMGGPGGTFLTTHWSMIGTVQSSDDRNRDLIGLLLSRYWKPVYCYLRRTGYGNEQAKDLTQGFFHEIVLGLNLIQRADQSKGRFRSFLLFALNQYLVNEQRKQTAQRRIPQDRIVSLDAIKAPVMPPSVVESSAEDSYHYAWVSALLDHVLSDVERMCCQQGMETHWRVFRERVVLPMLNNTARPSLAEVCREHGIESEKKASNMIITVKRRFQAVLRQYVRSTVASDSQTEDELKQIMQFLPRRAQHSQ